MEILITRRSSGILENYSGKGIDVKIRGSLAALKRKEGSIVVRRHGKVFVINKKSPNWKARQG